VPLAQVLTPKIETMVRTLLGVVASKETSELVAAVLVSGSMCWICVAEIEWSGFGEIVMRRAGVTTPGVGATSVR
jgi:hypothetical protein